MNTPLAYSAVPMAPSATRTRLPSPSRNSAALVCITVVGIVSIKNLAERDLNRRRGGAEDSVLNQTHSLGGVAESLLRFGVQDPNVAHSKGEIIDDLFLHPAHPVFR